MKKFLSIIFHSKYKWGLLVSLGLSIIISIVIATITNNNVLEILAISVFVSLFINLMSSFVTIIFIEERDKRELAQIEEKRQAVVIFKLIKIIKEYNDFFANVYKATSFDEIKDLEIRCANIFYETDIFIDHLNKLDFNKKGYRGRYLPKIERQRLIRNKKHDSMTYTWFEIFAKAAIAYVEAIYSIQDYYLFCLNNTEIIESINKISSMRDVFLKMQSRNFEMVKEYPNKLFPDGADLCKCHLNPDGKKLKVPIVAFHTLDTIFYTKQIMAEIDKITGTENFRIESWLFTSDNITPKIGSGIDEGKVDIMERYAKGIYIYNKSISPFS